VDVHVLVDVGGLLARLGLHGAVADGVVGVGGEALGAVARQVVGVLVTGGAALQSKSGVSR